STLVPERCMPRITTTLGVMDETSLFIQCFLIFCQSAFAPNVRKKNTPFAHRSRNLEKRPCFWISSRQRNPFASR
ncbi:hypothetical protein AAIH00_34965, partial [Pseudomonas aeruginosa]